MKSDKTRLRKYAGIAIVLVIILAAVGLAKKNGGAKPIIRTDVVKRGTVTVSVSANGVLQPLTTVEVRSNVGGQVVELTIDEGDYVKAGQLIARIDPSDSLTQLRQAQADLASARAQVEQAMQGSSMQLLQTSASIESAEHALAASKQRLAQAEQEAKAQPKLTAEAIRQAQSALEAAEANYEQVKNALVPQKIAAAKASYDQARAAFEQAEKELKRKKALLEKGFVAQSQVDAAEEQFAVAKAQLASAQSKLDTVRQEADQDIKSAEAKVSQAKAAYEAALANRVQDTIKQQELAAARAAVKQALATLKAARANAYQNQIKKEEILRAQAQLARAEAAVKNAKTQLGYCTITAPRSGIIVKKYVEKGSIVTAGRSAFGGGTGAGITIAEIADVSRMQVLVDVDETDIARIRVGQDVDVTFDAFPGEHFRGKVIKIAPQAVVEQNVTTIPVTVELEHADSRLKPEMNATCEFIIMRKRNVLYVPNEAVKETDRGTFVTVLKNGKQEERRVRTGAMGDEYTEILSGLTEGERIVTAVIEPVTPATAVQTGAGPGGGRGMRGGPPRPF
ncbi:MAG: efflux RND transporter periplasmic adaptor subunit [Armatimonadota bacterium]|nr:efflux RND transporter periplasmic adaptor subunit [Armatimonadota bacterium]